MPSASLWASVPHYVAAAPNPKAALALVRKLESLLGVIGRRRASSRRAAAEYERQVSLAVQSDPDVQAFVERLEQAAEEEEPSEIDPQDLPSGDVLAREFQRFLRQRGPGRRLAHRRIEPSARPGAVRARSPTCPARRAPAARRRSRRAPTAKIRAPWYDCGRTRTGCWAQRLGHRPFAWSCPRS